MARGDKPSMRVMVLAALIELGGKEIHSLRGAAVRNAAIAIAAGLTRQQATSALTHLSMRGRLRVYGDARCANGERRIRIDPRVARGTDGLADARAIVRARLAAMPAGTEAPPAGRGGRVESGRPPKKVWTAELVARLETLARDSALSARDIAAELGVSRSAVIGALRDRPALRAAFRDRRGLASEPPQRRRAERRRRTEEAAPPTRSEPEAPAPAGDGAEDETGEIAEAGERESGSAAFEAGWPRIPPRSRERSEEGFDLAQLTHRQCRWPLWGMDPADPRRGRFCGAAAPAGKPYCAAHLARAYAPRPDGRREAA